MSNYKVYVHVNKHNSKKYFGITRKKPKERWKGGYGYVRNTHFYRAIQVYGWDDGFEHYVLFDGLDKETACNIEQMLIAEHMTTNKQFGYNLTSGGEHYTPSKQTLEKMRNKSPETIQRMKDNHAGGAKAKPILCVETGVVYEGIKPAARATGIDHSLISRCCRNVPHNKTAGGYHWQFIGGN